MSARTAWVVRLCLLLSIAIGFQSTFAVAERHSLWAREFRNYYHNFNDLEVSEFYELVTNHSETPVPLTIENVAGNGLKITFSVSTHTAVYLSVSADSAETVFVHPLILQRDDEQKYLLPLIRSSIPGRFIWNSVSLGSFEPGEHTLLVSQHDSVSLELPQSIRFSASRPTYDSSLAVFIDNSPVIILKDSSNVLDDIPLAAYSKIEKRVGNRYKVTTRIIFSSENGGTKPVPLMASTNRTLDIEWVTQQVFVVEDNRLEPGRRKFQKERHGEAEFAGMEMLGNRPVLSIITANNNFGDGKVHIAGWNFPVTSLGVASLKISGLERLFPALSSAGDDEVIIYLPKPEFMPPGEGWRELIADTPEWQEWSQLELAIENCVDLSDMENPLVQEFQRDLEWVKQHLAVSFPDRGCGNQLLQLPPIGPDVMASSLPSAWVNLGAFSWSC